MELKSDESTTEKHEKELIPNGKLEETNSEQSANVNQSISVTNSTEESWYKRFVADFGEELAKKKPSAVPWNVFYINNIDFDSTRGRAFAKRAIKTIEEDSMTTMQELVLSGDAETVEYQISREKERVQLEKEAENEYTFDLSKQNSLMHYAVLSGSEELIHMIVKEGGKELINQEDLITKFTPLHYAVFCENRKMVRLLISLGADPDRRDTFSGSPFDYAKLLGLIPNTQYKNLKSIKIFTTDDMKVNEFSIQQVENLLSIHFQPFISCGNEYIEELMFSGLSITPDLEFRARYQKDWESSSGDENLVLAKINDHVGWGVFAAKNFKEGDFIVRYGGHLTASQTLNDKSYNMASGVEGMGINALKKRNLGGIVNHSDKPNAECQCSFDRGHEVAIITAKMAIPKGTQILMDYSKNYWSKATLKQHRLQDLSKVPPLPLP